MKLGKRYNGEDLNDRERAILRSIVQLFILTAEPVGSRNLSKYLESELNLSAATIRNVMADLEERDYISHLHTSAGRMPTDKGYRYYVDSLMNMESLSSLDIASVKNSLKGDNAESVLKEASSILGSISKYLAVAQIPYLRHLIIKKIEIIPLSTSRAIIIIALESNIIRTISIEVDFEITHSSVEQINSLINDKVSGKPLEYIASNFHEIAKDLTHVNPPLLRVFIDSIENLLIESSKSERLKISGAVNLFNYPEFEDLNTAKGVIELIENEDAILHVLDNAIDDYSTKAIIGSELGSELLNDYSMVLSKYFLGGSRGAIGIIGPKRMNYSRMMTLVGFVSSLLSENK